MLFSVKIAGPDLNQTPVSPAFSDQSLMQGIYGTHPHKLRWCALVPLYRLEPDWPDRKIDNEQKRKRGRAIGANAKYSRNHRVGTTGLDLLITANQVARKFDGQKPVFKVEIPKFCS